MAIDDLDYAAARRLVCAVTLSAIKEARAGDTEAAAWLMNDAAAWLEAVDLDDITPGDMRAAIADRTPVNRGNLGRG